MFSKLSLWDYEKKKCELCALEYASPYPHYKAFLFSFPQVRLWKRRWKNEKKKGKKNENSDKINRKWLKWEN